MNIDEDRLKHSIAVARKKVNIAKEMKLTQEQQQECFIIGYNHDIGYVFSKNQLEHNIKLAEKFYVRQILSFGKKYIIMEKLIVNTSLCIWIY